MQRNETEIVYASLESFIREYSALPAEVPCKFDYQPKEIQEEITFPSFGIRRVSDVDTKRLDRHSEYMQIQKDGIVYSCYEIGFFSMTCTVALYMDFEEVNPIPFLRSWYSDIKRRAIKRVRIDAIGDIPNELLTIKIKGDPFEQIGERLYSLKFTVDVEGRILDWEEARPQLPGKGIKIRV
ncbi:hypothetical protein FZD47_25320 [Bacillus infantis]|uniref:Uncharacterized protein n=1 Tax=Bacillus infantis TaxID=324767 RepID=A0A5D4RZF3_9BACI|nr:hypothetical protein [Bacillus infantis]TYS55751.1 hypothetical protein FZD47_25320 [Bacillus infantis]